MSNHAARKLESTPAPGRRRRNGSQSRRLLLESALDLLSKGKAPTSVNITKAAGLAQPTFYAHFKSVDACLLAAAEYVQSRVDERRAAWRRYHQGQGPLHRDALVRAIADWLEAAETTGVMLDALSRFREDDSLLGDLVRDIHDGIVHQLAGELFGVAEACGVGPGYHKDFLILAELHNAAVTAMAHLIHDGKVASVDEGAETLADNLGAMLRRTIAEAGGDVGALESVSGF